MANFPILQQMVVKHYGLYPGKEQQGHFEIPFRDGLTLILGANGLGKTTLVTMLFRLLTGTGDISLPEGRIGSADLSVQNLDKWSQRQFAQRVNDGAREAEAQLQFQLGPRRFQLTRRLTDLALTSLIIDDQPADANESSYRKAITAAAELGSFADLILVLRTLVFYFEDRRDLVWDTGAQKQLLRALLLSPAQAQEWTKRERTILELDSRMRNLSNALNREKRESNNIVQRTTSAPGVRQTLTAAQARLEQLNEQHARLVERLDITDRMRHRARLDAIRAEAEQDKALRELERARLLAIDAHLPKADESIRFILARLMSDETCLVCGTEDVAARRQSLERALDQRRCVVCDSKLGDPSLSDVVEITDERLRVLKERYDAFLVQAADQGRVRDEANAEHLATSAELAACAQERDETDQKVRDLQMQLPPDQRRVTDQQKRLNAAAELVTDMRARLKVARTEFGEFLGEHREQIAQFANAIKAKFGEAAEGFLFEESQLSWSPTRMLVGQAGADGVEPVEYPAFAVDLTGSDFAGLKRRGDPNEVSESQREFIDLAFRMALVHVASPNSAASLVIDAPESSLDAVFVERAATVLGRFAKSGNNGANRLIVTSNLGAGKLVPCLLKEVATPGEAMAPVVDLFHAGVPTRAMVAWKAQYEALWNQLIEDVGDGDGR
jgi:ABC-type oligopeptide transport system ATPase subunit